MKIVTTLMYSRISITEPQIEDTYYIEQDSNNKRFYITSDNGYNGYEGDGHIDIESAIKHVKKMVRNYFTDRSEPNPKGW